MAARALEPELAGRKGRRAAAHKRLHRGYEDRAACEESAWDAKRAAGSASGPQRDAGQTVRATPAAWPMTPTLRRPALLLALAAAGLAGAAAPLEKAAASSADARYLRPRRGQALGPVALRPILLVDPDDRAVVEQADRRRAEAAGRGLRGCAAGRRQHNTPTEFSGTAGRSSSGRCCPSGSAPRHAGARALPPHPADAAHRLSAGRRQRPPRYAEGATCCSSSGARLRRFLSSA